MILIKCYSNISVQIINIGKFPQLRQHFVRRKIKQQICRVNYLQRDEVNHRNHIDKIKQVPIQIDFAPETDWAKFNQGKIGRTQ